MKTIENKVTTMKGGADNFIKYSDLLKTTANQPVKDGFSVDEMDKRLRITRILEKAGETIKLEDSDFNVAKWLVNTQKWGIIHEDISNFVKYINTL